MPKKAKDFYVVIDEMPNTSETGEAEAIAQNLVDVFFDLENLYERVTDDITTDDWTELYTAVDSRYPAIAKWEDDHADEADDRARGEGRLIEDKAIRILTAAIVRKLR